MFTPKLGVVWVPVCVGQGGARGGEGGSLGFLVPPPWGRIPLHWSGLCQSIVLVRPPGVHSAFEMDFSSPLVNVRTNTIVQARSSRLENLKSQKEDLSETQISSSCIFAERMQQDKFSPPIFTTQQTTQGLPV